MTELPKPPSKYRRAFDWRLSQGEGRLGKPAAEAMVRLASSDLPDILEDFLSISRKRQRNPTAMARLQLHMLEELLVQEGALKHYRQRLKELENEAVDPQEKEKQVHIAKREQFFHRMYSNAIRAIGDGIAWRTLGYDRAVTRILGERQTKQLLLSEGIIQELREWGYQFDIGSGIAILNALTNCLAIADVTVIRSDGSVEIVEVKSSKTKSRRKIRQKQAMKEVVTLLGTGKGQNEERDVQIELLPITPENSLPKIEELLEVAKVKGWGGRRISDCLYVEALDYRKIGSIEDVEQLTGNVRKNAIREWEERGDNIFDMNSLEAIAYTPNSAPFSIFPFRARTCVDLLIGAISYIAFLNLSAVEREFVKRGWVLEKDFKALAEEGIDSLKESMLQVKKGPFHCSIPPSDFMRMQVETLRPKTLIDAMEWKYRQGPQADQGYLLAVYEGESKVWN